MSPEQPDPGPEDRSRLDVDAAFAEIVAHWDAGDPDPDETGPASTTLDSRGDPSPYDGARLGPPAEPVAEEPEEHFVPPPPPPLPSVEPRRKLAWTGLLGAPVLALVLVALGVVVPGWVAVGLVVGFVGGFGYLVATMSSTPHDPWSGDDGAVL